MKKESSSRLTPNSSPKPPIRWLITGGCGFIGLNLVKNLIEEGGHYIRIIDNLSVGTRGDLLQVCNFTELDPKSFSPQPLTQPSALIPDDPQSSVLSPQSSTESSVLSPQNSSEPSSVQLIAADILDYDLAVKAAEGIDVIVHFAASTGVPASVEDPRFDCISNVIGTLNYLEAARHSEAKRFIFASSGAPIGECDPPIHEELAPHPVSPYGASKLAGEGYCSAYYRTFEVETVSLRFGNVFGPLSSNKNSVVAKFIRRALEGKPLEIYGDGNQTRDFIYIEDLIRAIRLAVIAEKVGGETFQIATNAETTVNELVKKLLHILKNAGHGRFEVYNSDSRLGDVRRNFSDTTKAREILGWQSKVDFADGLKRTVNWFLEK